MKARNWGLVAAALLAGLIGWHFLRAEKTPARVAAPDNSPVANSSATDVPERPAPRLFTPARSHEDIAGAAPQSNLLMRLKDGDSSPAVSLEQVAGYLWDNHRNAESLLGAFNATKDKSFLAEAMTNFPNDPRVAFAAATLQQFNSPEEQRKWLDAFKQSAPDNAMADYLSAAAYFKSGQTELALQDVQAGAAKPLRDYHLDLLQSAEEAYRGAGLSDVEANTYASINLMLPELANYKTVGVQLGELADKYRQAGDPASADAALQMAMNLGQRVEEANATTLIQKLVGLAVEKIALSRMDPNTIYDNQPVQSRLEAIQQQRATINALNQQWETVIPNMSDQDVVDFHDRLWRFGEVSAMHWAVDKFSPPANGR